MISATRIKKLRAIPIVKTRAAFNKNLSKLELGNFVRLGFDMRVYKAVYYWADRPSKELLRRTMVVEGIIKTGTIVYTGFLSYRSRHRKMRAEAFKTVRFLRVRDSYKKPKCTYGFSSYDSRVKYKVGQYTRPKRPYSLKTETCESGIHFFLNRKEAANYL